MEVEEGGGLFVLVVKGVAEVDECLKIEPCVGRRRHRRFRLVVVVLEGIEEVVVQMHMKAEERIGLTSHISKIVV